MARTGLAVRGRRRPPSGRQEEIARVGRTARAQGNELGGGQRPMVPRRDLGKQGGPMLGRARAAMGRAVGQASAAKINVGDQLRRRVKAGAITPEQAQQTARQRQTLEKKFGDDWRDKLPGGAGAFREARQKLADNPNDPRLIALNKRLQGRRQKLLAAAEGGGQPRPGGKVNPRGRGMMNPPGESPARPGRRRVARARRAY